MDVKAVALAGCDRMTTGAAASVRVDRPICAPPYRNTQSKKTRMLAFMKTAQNKETGTANKAQPKPERAFWMLAQLS